MSSVNATTTTHLASMNATTTHLAGRALAQASHNLHRSGTLCLGGKLAPLVMMLGCQRCGLQSLYQDILDHIPGSKAGHSLRGEPEYYGREQHFFATDTWDKGLHHYLEHFPACPAHADKDLTFTVDATPAYMRKPIVTVRLAQVRPRDTYPPVCGHRSPP